MMHEINRPTRSGRNAGFSLAELIVVIGIMLLVLAMMAPAMKQMIASNRDAEAFNGVSGALTAARAYAVGNGVTTAVTFYLGNDYDSDDYSIRSRFTLSIPRDESEAS